MKKIHTTLMFIALLYSSLPGQEYSMEFGEVSEAELLLDHYPKDKEAGAIVLFDMGKSYFEEKDGSFHVIFERTTRIKVLSEQGIEWAQVEIPYSHEDGINERVNLLEANIYNYENGKVIKTPFDLNNTFDEKVSDVLSVKKFTLPDVKKQSVIEYTYKISSTDNFNLRDWEFQWKIPVLYSEYKVKMVPFYEYAYILQGRKRFDVQESYADNTTSRTIGTVEFQDRVHKYAMKDVPGFTDEEFISSIDDYIIKIDFQLAKIIEPNGASKEIQTTWENMIGELLKDPDFGKYISNAERLSSKKAQPGGIADLSERERFNHVIDYMKHNYTWTQQNAKYANTTPRKLNEGKSGNSAELNLYTVGMLKSHGIDSYPVLISTRDHGKIKYDYPFSHFFNYVIVLAYVDGNPVLTDVTEVSAMNDRIPAHCINGKGLIINEEEVDWIKLNSNHPSEKGARFAIELVNDNFIVDAQQHFTEYDAIRSRKIYSNDIGAVARKLDSYSYNTIDESIEVRNLNAKEKPLVLKYKFSSAPERIDDKIYLAPFFNEPLSENPLKQKSRTHPIDMIYPTKNTLNSTLYIPEGYDVESLPDNLSFENQHLMLNYSVSYDKERVVVDFDYSFKNSVYHATDYDKIKYFFGEIVKKGNEKIVLSKTSS